MRIAFTHAYCWPEVRRGAERFTQQLGAALVRRGHEVTILSSGWEATTDVLDGVTTVRLPRRRDDGYAHEADFGRRAALVLLRERFDAVHSMGRHDAVASIRAAWLRRDRRTVITDLGLPSTEWWNSQPAAEGKAVRRVVRGIDVYSCMSQYALDFLPRDYGRFDGVVVPGGVDMAGFAPAPARAPRPTVLFSGIISEPRKGVATLLAALPLLAEHEPDVELWLSGPGDPDALLAAASPEARAMTTCLGVGESDRQHERYGQAWVTALPSTHDSFGMVLIESLACGTPLVVSTHGAPPELATPGATGEICSPGDAASLAEALRRALALTRKGDKTVAACRATAACFDWDGGLAPWVERIYQGDRFTVPGPYGRPPSEP